MTALFVIAAILIEVRNQSGGLAAPEGNGIGLAEAADLLAMAVGAQCRREEERRRAHDPFPLHVCWHNARETLMDHPANVHRARARAGATP